MSSRVSESSGGTFDEQYAKLQALEKKLRKATLQHAQVVRDLEERLSEYAAARDDDKRRGPDAREERISALEAQLSSLEGRLAQTVAALDATTARADQAAAAAEAATRETLELRALLTERSQQQQPQHRPPTYHSPSAAARQPAYPSPGPAATDSLGASPPPHDYRAGPGYFERAVEAQRHPLPAGDAGGPTHQNQQPPFRPPEEAFQASLDSAQGRTPTPTPPQPQPQQHAHSAYGYGPSSSAYGAAAPSPYAPPPSAAGIGGAVNPAELGLSFVDSDSARIKDARRRAEALLSAAKERAGRPQTPTGGSPSPPRAGAAGASAGVSSPPGGYGGYSSYGYGYMPGGYTYGYTPGGSPPAGTTDALLSQFRPTTPPPPQYPPQTPAPPLSPLGNGGSLLHGYYYT